MFQWDLLFYRKRPSSVNSNKLRKTLKYKNAFQNFECIEENRTLERRTEEKEEWKGTPEDLGKNNTPNPYTVIQFE